MRTRGYAVPAEVAAKLEALAPWQYVVVQSVARRIAAPDVPSIPTTDDTDVAGFVDGYVARLPRRLRRDLLRALGFVEHLAPLGVGFASRFTRLAPADQDRVLASLESNAVDLLRGAFDGLKSLVFMGYYRDPRTWTILRYDGPIVGRPEAGGGASVIVARARPHAATSRSRRDAVVVGTGAGGSIALRELARAGVDAIGLEEGGHHTPRDFTQDEARMIPMLFQDRGGRATKDLAIRVLQGRGVGGSTVHNTNLCKRTPDEILELWARVATASAAARPRRCGPHSRRSSVTSP